MFTTSTSTPPPGGETASSATTLSEGLEDLKNFCLIHKDARSSLKNDSVVKELADLLASGATRLAKYRFQSGEVTARVLSEIFSLDLALNISDEFKSLLNGLIRELRDFKVPPTLDCFIEIMKSNSSSEDLRASLKNPKLIKQFRDCMNLLTEISKNVKPVDDTKAQAIILRDSFVESLKVHPISDELRSLIDGINRELEDCKDPVTVSEVVELSVQVQKLILNFPDLH